MELDVGKNINPVVISGEHSIVSRKGGYKFRLHSYLSYFANKYWCMWSRGLVTEDQGNQCVCYSTSYNGMGWEEERIITPPEKKFRYISRGFWIRDNSLRALVSRDEVGKYFGKSLELQSFLWNEKKSSWEYEGVVFKDTISNFPPKKLSSGIWIMVRRDQNRNISFLLGGTESISSWEVIPFSEYEVEGLGKLEEPDCIFLPNHTTICLFRDNNKSNLLLQSFSKDNGRSWSTPSFTKFPNVTSKFNIIQVSTGHFVLVNNVKRGVDSFCLSVFNSDLVFGRMFSLEIPEIIEVETNLARELFQYPNVIEKDRTLLISFSRRKQTVEVIKIRLDEIIG